MGTIDLIHSIRIMHIHLLGQRQGDLIVKFLYFQIRITISCVTMIWGLSYTSRQIWPWAQLVTNLIMHL
jgi:hypothetical protein